MDRALGGRKSSAHEVALADLVATASLTGGLPAARALVAVQPECCEWGLAPSAAVGAALPHLQAAVEELLCRWGCR
jgi:hydrogenase maturation protease